LPLINRGEKGRGEPAVIFRGGGNAGGIRLKEACIGKNDCLTGGKNPKIGKALLAERR